MVMKDINIMLQSVTRVWPTHRLLLLEDLPCLFLFPLSAQIWFLFWISLSRRENDDDHRILMMCPVKKQISLSTPSIWQYIGIFICPLTTPICAGPGRSFCYSRGLCDARYAIAPRMLQWRLQNLWFLFPGVYGTPWTSAGIRED